MSVIFRPVATKAETEQLAQLAHEIWNEYWPALIGQEQTDYMVGKFQSLEAIKEGMRAQGYRYWLVVDTDEQAEGVPAHHAIDLGEGPVRVMGYTGGYTEAETNRFFISKIYLLAEARGHGYCSKVIAHYEKLCASEGLGAMYLTVNKHNELGIRAYLGKGFETIDAVESDIGNGFVMDDYIMQKTL